jgi:hypothetical protein
MKHISIVRNIQHLDDLFAKISAFSEEFELQSHWAKYLCILVSGFLETSVRIIYSDYANNKAAPNVAKYVDSSLKRFQNPDMDRILQLTGSFNSQWRETLKNATEDELGASVNSIINNRHRIAHGLSSDITYARIQDYYKGAIRVIELIEEQCDE